MSYFKSYSTVSETEKTFTEMIKKLKDMVKDFFPSYHAYDGYVTNDFNEVVADYPSDLFEDETEDLHVIYFPSLRATQTIVAYLQNYDFIYVKNGKCVPSQSNHPDIARHLNKMLKFCQK